jgi:hypothetical protein
LRRSSDYIQNLPIQVSDLALVTGWRGNYRATTGGGAGDFKKVRPHWI